MSFRRRLLVGLLAVAGVLSVVILAIWLSVGKPAQRPGGAGAGTRTPTGSAPKVTFADGARTGNTQLDTFVREFVETCLKGDYDQYRLCWTAYTPPISSSRFRAMWDMAEHIVINQIAPLPGKTHKKVYVVRASAKLNPRAKIQHTDVELLVQWEDEHWVIAPAARSELQDQDLPPQPVTDSAPASQPSAASPQHG